MWVPANDRLPEGPVAEMSLKSLLILAQAYLVHDYKIRGAKVCVTKIFRFLRWVPLTWEH